MTTQTAEDDVVLIVDDEPTNLEMLNSILEGAGYRTLVAKSGELALKIAASQHPSLVLLDIMMPGIDGFEVCRRLKADDESRDAAVVFLSALDDKKDKVKGFALGAVDYVSKPFEAEEVLARVRTHLEVRRLQRETEAQNTALQHELEVARELVHEAAARLEGPLIGDSEPVEALRAGVAVQANRNDPLVVFGDPGVGLEGVARAIHERSARNSRPFLHVDALSVTDRDVVDVFGTGRSLLSRFKESKPGKFGLAAGGTFCIENIEALGPSLQAELLKRIEDVDEGREGADVRIILLSARDFSQADSGVHRIDSRLLSRLARNVLRIPPLRDRAEDIPALIEHFLEKKAARMGKTVEKVSRTSMKRLKAYSWPGNLDELQSVLECALTSSQGGTLEVDPSLLEAGSRVGAYQLVEKLGAGGMGEVWLARHRLLIRPAAVKLIHANRVSNPKTQDSALKRFEREAKATARLESPNTVRLYDYGVNDEGAFFYVMERLRGLDLGDIVKKYGPLPPERTAYLLAQACGSLAEAHERGMIHRDIKPANLFASILGHDFDVLKILDFGIVRDLDEGDDLDLTAGGFVGTPNYIAPESAMAKDDVDGRADLYSLGCVAFYLLTGETVFKGKSAMAVLAMHTGEPAPPVSSATKAAIPPALEALIASCLEKDPAKRPADADAMRIQLERIEFDDPWSSARAASWWKDAGLAPPAGGDDPTTTSDESDSNWP